MFTIRGLTTIVVVAGLVIACDNSSKSKAPTPNPTPVVKDPVKEPVKEPVKPVEPAKPPDPWYRAELAFPKTGALPFYIQIPKESGEAFVANGDERVPFKAEWNGDKLTLSGPWSWVTRIDATRAADGKLSGMWTRDTPLWGKVERAFTASPVDAPAALEQFAGSATPATDVTSAWKFKFDQHGQSVGKLVMTKDGAVSGFVRPGALSDLRYLTGEVQGDKVMLAYFNGNAANLVMGTLSADGKSMKGMMSMQNVWNEPFKAEKVADAEYKNPVRLKAGKTKLSLPVLDKYKGKPVVAVFGATWCPGCNDMFPFLVKLHEKHKDKLQVVTMTYDLSTTQEDLDRELEKFRAKYKIPWEMVAMKTTPAKWAGDMPPEIEEWDGFPITVFIKPDGTVHAIYGGWFSAAAPEEHEKLKADFERWATEIAAST